MRRIDVSRERRQQLSHSLAQLSPSYAQVKRLRLSRDPRAPFTDRLSYDAFPRPHYAYGVYYAALQAKALGLRAVSVYEFGVGWGYGLLELEKVATLVERETGVSVQVFGFDTGAGMPEPVDHRDLPNVWKPTFFQMDVEKLKANLTRATLVLGNVGETVEAFIDSERPAPVGFIALDVDYYSSSVSVLRLFDAPADFLLPRVYCYVDDIVGDDWEIHCEYVGELLAIREFNEQHPERKLCKIHAFSAKRRIPATWNEQMHVMHAFDHPLYEQYVNPKPEWEEFKLGAAPALDPAG